MYDIKNALTEKSLPLSDNIHGPYKMMPPELLHTSGSGLIIRRPNMFTDKHI